MNTEEQDYKKGFNNGYLLAKHRPELKLPTPDKEAGEYYQGLDAGGKQYQLELKREQLKKEYGLDKDRGQENGRSR